MIKPNELKLGNKVMRPPSVGVLTVCMIESSGSLYFEELPDNHFDIEDNEINPIPLTPEWLERCGFVQSEHGNLILWLSKKSKLVFFKGSIQLESVDNPMGAFLDHIKTVHQLQNLYFALTGEELEIKMP